LQQIIYLFIVDLQKGTENTDLFQLLDRLEDLLDGSGNYATFGVVDVDVGC
jgi:hypothetical protein